MAIPGQGSRPVVYPESDGKPLAESEIHWQQVVDLYASLRAHFRARPEVHVSSNLFLYYEEGKPASVVAPDVMVIVGIPPGWRRTFKLWEEGKVPDVVIEVTSAKTRREDVGVKRATYARLGVREYYMFDPTEDYLSPPLRAFRLHGGEYLEVIERPLISPALGLELRALEGFLRLVDPATGRLLPVPDDYAEEFAETLEANTRALEAEERARQAEARARAAEEELARLRRDLGTPPA